MDSLAAWLVIGPTVEARYEGLAEDGDRKWAMRSVLRRLEVRRDIRMVLVEGEIAVIRRKSHGVEEEPDDA